MREKKEINVQIGERIKLARENAKLTQEQFAERIDVSPQSTKHWDVSYYMLCDLTLTFFFTT